MLTAAITESMSNQKKIPIAIARLQKRNRSAKTIGVILVLQRLATQYGILVQSERVPDSFSSQTLNIPSHPNRLVVEISRGHSLILAGESYSWLQVGGATIASRGSASVRFKAPSRTKVRSTQDNSPFTSAGITLVFLWLLTFIFLHTCL